MLASLCKTAFSGGVLFQELPEEGEAQFPVKSLSMVPCLKLICSYRGWSIVELCATLAALPTASIVTRFNRLEHIIYV